MIKSKIFLWLWGFINYKTSQSYLLKLCYDNWIMFFDTAYEYWDSELILWRFIKDKKRSDIIISTKCKINILSHIDIINSCYDSLNKLGTDYIDIFFIHYPNDIINLKYIIWSLLFLKNKWFIKNIWFCNLSYSRLLTYHKLLGGNLDYIQIKFNCISRYADYIWILKYCHENNINVMTWGTFNQNKNLKLYTDIFIKKTYDIYQYLLYYNISRYDNIYPIIWISSEKNLKNLLNMDYSNIKKEFLDIEKKILNKWYILDNNKFL